MSMDARDEILEVPRAPRRIFTVSDWLFTLSAPVVLYLGGVAAAGGNVNGLVLVGFAGLIVVTLRMVRVGRRNEPRVSSWSGYGAIAVAVFGFVWSWTLFQDPANFAGEQFLWPIVPVGLYFIFIVAMFAPRRTR